MYLIIYQLAVLPYRCNLSTLPYSLAHPPVASTSHLLISALTHNSFTGYIIAKFILIVQFVWFLRLF
jgi:hypothetical protein